MCMSITAAMQYDSITCRHLPHNSSPMFCLHSMRRSVLLCQLCGQAALLGRKNKWCGFVVSWNISKGKKGTKYVTMCCPKRVRYFHSFHYKNTHVVHVVVNNNCSTNMWDVMAEEIGTPCISHQSFFSYFYMCVHARAHTHTPLLWNICHLSFSVCACVFFLHSYALKSFSEGQRLKSPLGSLRIFLALFSNDFTSF